MSYEEHEERIYHLEEGMDRMAEKHASNFNWLALSIATVWIGAVLLFFSGCAEGIPDPMPNGEACELAEDCLSDTCLLELGELEFPDGLCVTYCMGIGEEACTETETCLVYNPTGESYCYQNCVTDRDCREGYSCQGGFQSCLPE